MFFTRQITSEGLIRAYEAMGGELRGKVAVKLSTGEPGGHNFLQPALIQKLVTRLNGTIVECNTAYRGKALCLQGHWQAIGNTAFWTIAPCDHHGRGGRPWPSLSRAGGI